MQEQHQNLLLSSFSQDIADDFQHQNLTDVECQELVLRTIISVHSQVHDSFLIAIQITAEFEKVKKAPLGLTFTLVKW